MNQSEIRVDVISSRSQYKGQVAYPPQSQFVKITHVPSGISVTKEARSQMSAKLEAMEEIEMLVELWEKG